MLAANPKASALALALAIQPPRAGHRKRVRKVEGEDFFLSVASAARGE